MNEHIATVEQFIAGIRAMCCTRERADVEFLRAQVSTLLGVIGNKRILLTDEQRRLLATTGIAAKDSLVESSLNFKPETILKWHRALKAAKWDFSKRRKAVTGRPPTAADTEAVIVKLGRDNLWGYDRIVGEMSRQFGVRL